MRKNLIPPRQGGNYFLESPDILKQRTVPPASTAGTEATAATGIQNPDLRDPHKGYLGNAIYLSRTFLGEAVLVNTTPTLIKQTSRAQPYLLLNPAKSLGLTNTAVAFNGTASGSGTSESNPIGVAGYMEAHIFINITAVTGTWDIGTQALDPTTGNWVNTQTLVAATGTTGEQYYYIKSMGVATDLAFFWTQDTAGSITMSITVVLKLGSGGSSLGLSQSLFLGSSSGVSPVSGFPLLEGTSQNFILAENMQLWGIALVPLTINLFQL